VEIEDFTLRNVPARLEEVGDLYKPLLQSRGRFDLRALL
jgi:bifunctional non-homologous end joining protein LigD